MEESANEGNELLLDFCDEAMDLLQELPEELTRFAQDPTDTEAINVVFRAVHTVKGNAGFFGLTQVKEFAHSLEDAFDEMRQDHVTLNEELNRNLIKGIDILGEMVIQIQNGTQDDANVEANAELLATIKVLCDSSRVDSSEDRLLKEILALADEIAASELSQGSGWANKLRNLAHASTAEEPAEGETDNEGISAHSLVGVCFESAEMDISDQVEPLLALFVGVENKTYQREDGELFQHHLEHFATGFESEHPELAAELHAVRDDFATLFGVSMEDDPLILSVVWQRLCPTLESLRKADTSTAPPEKTKEESNKPSEEKQDNTKQTVKTRFLRVKEERVDDFLDDVSRLFITCERLKDLQLRMAGLWHAHEMVDELRQINGTLSNQSTTLQRSVVELRKVPVRGLFSKFPRVARSLASKLGKQLDVHLAGEDIEIDKSLLDDLDGPLMHMVRNVCDHGIDMPEEREQRGVSPAGTLQMECSLSKTHVLISVEDDGRGIDPQRLRAKAVEKGVLSAEAASKLTDQEAIELIFHPGFSTADQVSEVSGRGVGLDVVRTRLLEHNGDVKVSSTLGSGTTFLLEIPIRRAVVVVDGLLVKQGDATFVIPFDDIQEILSLADSQISTVQGKKVARVRGEPYAAVSLADLLEIETSPTDEPLSEAVLINCEDGTVLLLVESVIGQRKVVVSDLAAVLPDCDRTSGVAQLGGGKLALVLNTQELLCVSGTNLQSSNQSVP